MLIRADTPPLHRAPELSASCGGRRAPSHSPLTVEPGGEVLQDLLPLLLQNHQLFVLLSPQTLQVVQVNTLHLSQLTLRLLQVAFHIL